MKQELTIGDLAERTGLAVSAIRFYETHGIVHPNRNRGGHRRYTRADLRRLSFAMVAQRLGFPLRDIAAYLEPLPKDRAPGKADWMRISLAMRQDIDQRIADLVNLREKLDGCIGCGCLSLQSCEIYNPRDVKAQLGAGPQNL